MKGGLLTDQFPPNPYGDFIEVYMQGSITRLINVNQLSNYEELFLKIACMFNLSEDKYWGAIFGRLGLELMYTNDEEVTWFVGDRSWEVFASTVRVINIQPLGWSP